ncbi:MAG: hypothetical protein ABR517_11235 [Thermoanaerobaculia bacterium]
MFLIVVPVTAVAQIDVERAQTYFEEAALLCEREGGRIWGVSLCGPMVFADPATQSIATNQPAPPADRPRVLGFVNAPIEWGGTRWAAYVWPAIPEDDAQARGRLMLHELFHRVQPELGLMVSGPANDHLDALEGRYWLRLEWRALGRALESTGPARIAAIRDALAFRETRRNAFRGAAESERADELREGLAQYTGTVAAAASRPEAVADAVRQLAAAEDAPTFVRTFAYPSGTAYGLLLDCLSPGWARTITSTSDLGMLVMGAAKITPATDAEESANGYGGSELRIAEERRAQEQQTRVDELRRRFVEGPQLIVPRGRGAMLRTTGATPIPGEGTVFLEYRVTAEWGSLESSGVLQAADGATLRLPAPFQREGNTLTGEGWRVVLSPGWDVRDGDRAGDFRVVPDPE